MLLQDGCQIGLRDVIDKCTVAKDHCAVPGRRELGVPINNSRGKRLDFISINPLV